MQWSGNTVGRIAQCYGDWGDRDRQLAAFVLWLLGISLFSPPSSALRQPRLPESLSPPWHSP